MDSQSRKHLNNIQVILVDPQEPGNIGSVCRAMKTMGLSRLVITGDKKYDAERVKTLALHSYNIYQSSIRFPDLKSALSESLFSAGITRRRGKFRKYYSLLPEQFAEKALTISGGPVSMVFGRESDGLTDEELSQCSLAVHIPASDVFPSLNLSHAVQIMSYTLFRQSIPAREYHPVTKNRAESVCETITESLEKIGFFKLDEKEEVGRFFRDILIRSSISQNETERVEKMFRKIAAVSLHKNKQRQGQRD